MGRHAVTIISIATIILAGTSRLSAEPIEFTVLTYNAHLFEDSSLECICRCAEKADKCTWSKYQYDDGDTNGGRCYNCAAWVRSSNADIVAVQEVWANSFREWWTSVLKTGYPNYPYNYFIDSSGNCHSALDQLWRLWGIPETLPAAILGCALLHMEDDSAWRLNTLGNGLILLSKWPLQDFQFTRFPAYECGDPGTECWGDKGVITATATIGGAKIRVGISHALTGPDDAKSNWDKGYVPEAITTFNLAGNAYIFALKTNGQAHLTMFEDYTGVDTRTGKQVHGAGWKHLYTGDWGGGHEVVTSFELGGHPYLFGLDEGDRAHLVRVNDDPSTGWTRIFTDDWDPGCETVVPFEMQGHPYLFSIYGPNEARIVRINDDPLSGWSQVCSHTWDSGHDAVVGFQLEGHPYLFSIYGPNEAHIVRINDDPNTGWTTHGVGYPNDFSLVTTFDIDARPHLLVRDGANQAIILRVDNSLSPQLTEVKSQSQWFADTTDVGFVAVKSFRMNGHPYLFGIRDCCSQHPAPRGQPLPGEAYISRINDDPATGWEHLYQLEDIKIIRDQTIGQYDLPAIMMGDFNIHASKYPIMDQLFRKAGAIDAYIEVHGTGEGGETIDLKNNQLARIFCEDKPETSYNDCNISDPRVYPTEMTRDRIDYIYVKPSGSGLRLVPTDAYVIRNWKYGAGSMDLSDHYPLFVKFRLETGCKVHVKGDLDCDGFVDFPDLGILCSSWLSEPGSSVWDRTCDISAPGDDFIDMKDFEEFARQWRTKAVHNLTRQKAYASIQTAINDANEGDEIEVAPGTYYEAIDFKGKAVTLRSTDPNDPNVVAATVINGIGNYHVVQCVSGEDANTILAGFTITGGNATGAGESGYGGGMYNKASSPSVTNCIFRGNKAADGGGMLNNGSSPIMTNCTFTGNSASSNSGGMHNITNSSPTVTNCTFSGNTAVNDGGGMRNHSSSPTVTNCTFSQNSAVAYGGGMFNQNSSPTVTNCTFINNSVNYHGGGMHNITNSSPTVTNCTFSGNTAINGGGMHNVANSSPTVTNCTFSGNSASYGGGMGNWSSSNPTVTNCTFSQNSAVAYGGGMFNQTSSPAVTNCAFTGNSASSNGGGMGNWSSSNPTVTNCAFNRNLAVKYGGGMFNNNSLPTVTNCIFNQNIAQQALGGGIANYSSSHSTVTNCTFSGNVAGGGAGIRNWDSSPIVKNCILWDNEPDEIASAGTSVPIVQYCDIQGVTSGTGNINLDPLFVDAIGGNLRLLSGSPCIDAGNNGAAGLPATDLAGNPRIMDGDQDGTSTVDMGAFEFTDLRIRNVTRDILYVSIQAAINDANDGDEIEASPGTYYEAINFKGKAIRLYSSGGQDVTTIDGSGAYHVVQCINHEDANTILEGFTITGGNAPDNYGGGMLNKNSKPTVTNCNFMGNTARNGGGMGNYQGSNPTVTDCTFSGNSGYIGGAMCNDQGSNPTVTDCIFLSNAASLHGGGMHNEYSDPKVTNCIFSGNTASAHGGGMMNNYGSVSYTANCVFIGNTANGWGGGMCNTSCSPYFINCTFRGNTASSGGAIYSDNSYTNIQNCILWADGANEIVYSSGTMSVTYSDVQGGHDGTGNINADPLFVDATAGNLRLSSGSPCIDKGSNAAIPSGITTDLDGNPRVLDGDSNGTDIVDMGAYEYLVTTGNSFERSLEACCVLAANWLEAPWPRQP